MSERRTSVGLVSYGLHLPTGYETAAEIAERAGLSAAAVEELGLEGKPRPGAEDQPIPMAAAAVRRALAAAPGLEPAEVDLVLWTGEEYKDYIAQTAAIRLQEEVGCRNAWAFDLVGQGVTSLVGLRVAHDMMVSDETIETVLLAGGTRNVDLVDYANPHTRFLLAASASGGAMILKRGHGRNRLLSFAFEVHADMADEIFVPGGGTEHPFSLEMLDSPLMFFQAADPSKVDRYLKSSWVEGLTSVVKKAAGQRRIDYLALRHLAPGDRARILAAAGLKPGQSLPLFDLGHHGPNDVIISLDRGLESGAVEEGHVVVLAGGGIGFTYAAASIKWGPA